MKNEHKKILKVSILAGVLLITACSTATVAISPKAQNEEIANYILDQLSYDDQNILSYIWGPVSTGEKIITTNGPIFTTPCAGYVMYIDLYPTANLFHPVQYVFLKESTNDLQVFDEKYPPLNFNNYQLIENELAKVLFSAQNRRTPIPSKTTPNIGASGRDNRWAVLMNGGYDSGNNHVRYWNDLSNIYITLTTVYDFADENIIVLCSDGLNPAADQSNGQNSDPDLDGDGDNDIMYSCVLSNVDMVFAGLANNFTGTEKLFVFTTDHGSSAGGYDTIENLWNYEELTDAHFAELLGAIPAAEKICTLEPCFSGGFLDNIIGEPGPIVASSACRYDEYSWAMPPDYVYDTYVFHWTAAMKGEDAYGVPVDADANQDGIITMDEAYIYAVAHDTDDESPQYGEYPEGTGSYLSLKVSSNPPAQPTKPIGPTLGIWNIEYTYTSSTTEPDNEQIYYQYNWDDGSTSGWIGPYNSGQSGSASHIWTVLGTYNVTVKAKDTWGATSIRSEPLAVTITNNTPPDAPQITGPAEGKAGKPYLFNLLTTDAQDQDIYYYIDWGDNTTSGWLGPYISGTEIHQTHAWAGEGTYTVKAKAKDIMNSESDWATFSVAMPLEYRFSFSILLQHLFEKYPNLFPLLRHFMG
ncbi:MAG: hypothetical protein NTY91_00345 [Euryarchaeota archaeon]|nr:hypothetical protein [Euryarchaeota archaeon]